MTNAHCHLGVSDSSDVDQAQRALCFSSRGTLKRLQQEGLNSFSIFFIGSDSRTRFDAYITPEGVCLPAGSEIEWSQYQDLKSLNHDRSYPAPLGRPGY
jgi:hypothetical protein